MIRKIRIRFIIASTLATFIVLSVIVTGINVVNYSKVVRDADRILEILSSNSGAFPEPASGEVPPAPPQAQGFFTEPGMSNPEEPYDTRYFSVLLNSEGEVVRTDTEMIFAVDEASAEEYAGRALSSGRDSGFTDRYRYRITGTDEGRRVTFCDCTRSIENFINFRNASILISLGGLIVVSFLVTLLSGRIVRPVAESYEKQKRFITDAGHEIRTPLAIINADADVLETELSEDNEWLADIRKQTGRLTMLTNDLISLSKMEESELPAVREEFDISGTAYEITDSFASLARRGGKEIRTEIEPDIRYTGDERTIGHLFSILTDNAVKYSPDGSQIVFALHRQGRGVAVEVSNKLSYDMSPNDIRHMFDRFYRADRSRNSSTGGYGIGLSMAGAIAAAHKGKISASRKGDIITVRALLS